MNSLYLKNRISFSEYKNIRFSENMPEIESCKIISGKVAEIEVDFHSISIDANAYMKYYFKYDYPSLQNTYLVEQLIFRDNYNHSSPILSVILKSKIEKGQYELFNQKIFTITPIYYFGEFPHSFYAKVEKHGGYELMFEFLHQYFYGKYETRYERGVTKLKNQFGEELAVYLEDDCQYFITESILVGHEPLERKTLTKTKTEMIQDIIEGFKEFKGSYILGDQEDSIFFDPLEFERDSVKRRYEIFLKEEMDQDSFKLLEQLEYQYSFFLLTFDLRDNPTKENFFQLIDKYKIIEQDLNEWFEKYDYDAFLRKNYPDEYDDK